MPRREETVAADGRRRVAVVGGGILGLTIALRLARAGDAVTVIEAAPELGGLASAWELDGLVWDRHYHVTLRSDAHTRGLLRELGLEREMKWVETRTGYYSQGRHHPASNTIEYLKLPLALIDKLRIAGTIVLLSRLRRWERLEDVELEKWLRRWSGRRALKEFWRPQLRAKLGDAYPEASTAFLWATVQRLYAARRSGLKKEMFGYVPGGYARVLARLAEVLSESGVEILLGEPVARIDSSDGGVAVTFGDGASAEFDDVVVTAVPPVAARLCAGLDAVETRRLAGVRYNGIVCASLLLRKPLAGHYLTYIAEEVPFTTVVEMSAFVDAEQLGGRNLVYLPKYIPSDDPLIDAPDSEIEASFVPALIRLYPHLTHEDVTCFQVSRVRHVFPFPTLGYSKGVPTTRTSQRGLHLVSSANIVNGTLNVDETVALADRAAREMLDAREADLDAERARRDPE